MTNQVSNCCGEAVTAISEDEGTSYYVCDSCKLACDIAQESAAEFKQRLREWVDGQIFLVTNTGRFLNRDELLEFINATEVEDGEE